MKIVFKILKWLGITIGSLVLILFILNIIPFTFSKVKGDNEFRTNDYPLIIPHGGAKDLVPENTIYSFEMLVDSYEVDVLEIDLTLTKDNILISHHDLDLYNGTLIRTLNYQEIVDIYIEEDYYLARNFTDINGLNPFENKETSELSKMIPAKLEDIFNDVGNNTLYMLEIKDAKSAVGFDSNIHSFEEATQNLIDLVKEYELEEYVVMASFDDDVISYMKEHAPSIKVGAATDEATKFAIFSAFYIDFFWSAKSEVMILPIPESMKIPGSLKGLMDILPNFIRKNIAVKIDGVWHANLMNKQIIKDAHRKNIAVHYWTVNDTDQMRLLIENGADGIITDRPDLLIQIIEEMRQENGN